MIRFNIDIGGNLGVRQLDRLVSRTYEVLEPIAKATRTTVGGDQRTVYQSGTVTGWQGTDLVLQVGYNDAQRDRIYVQVDGVAEDVARSQLPNLARFPEIVQMFQYAMR